MVDERFQSFTLPWQLKDEKFIRLSGCTKDPQDGEAWSKNLRDAKFIEGHVRGGDNYGVAYTTNLAVVDADNFDRLRELCCMNLFEYTYMVQSGRDGNIGLHIYLRIPEETIPDFYKGNKVKNSKVVLVDPETGESLGDIRFPHTNFYNVGPYAIHPKTRRQYLPIDEDASIRFFSASDVLEVFDAVIQEKVQKPIAEFKPAILLPSELDYGFKVTDFLMPINAHTRSDGSIEGAHPFHESETGTNLTISPDRMMWYCRRHGTGGGWKKALAVSHRIIDCSDANRDFTRDELRQIDDILRHLNPAVNEKRWIARQQWLAEHRKSRLQNGRYNTSTPNQHGKQRQSE